LGKKYNIMKFQNIKAKSIVAVSLLSALFAFGASATITPPPSTLPTLKSECKNGGWQIYGVFKNQGDCVSFVATQGGNQPDGE